MKILRLILQIIGATTVLAVLGIVISVAIGMWKYGSNLESTERPEPQKLLFILNWGGIDNTQKFSVVFSSESPSSFTGDHLTYHCLQLENFNVSQTQKEGWRQGPESEEVFVQAIEVASNSAKYKECFINGGVPNTEKIYTYFWSIGTHGRNIADTVIIMVEPSSNRLLYVSLAT